MFDGVFKICSSLRIEDVNKEEDGLLGLVVFEVVCIFKVRMNECCLLLFLLNEIEINCYLLFIILILIINIYL